MSNRHLSRSIVLQSLFEWDFKGNDQGLMAGILEQNINEFGPGLEDGDHAFLAHLADIVIRNKSIIDEVISKAAPEWPLEKIGAVDRNVLRLGLAELLFGDRNQVPPKVAINESIELAKTFGGDSSGKFVNGVLGTIYKEIGEPGKEQVSKRKSTEPIDISKLPLQKLAGAVVYAKSGDEYYLALVHDVFGYWTLSKGKIEGNEEFVDGAKREIKEEIGLDVEIKEKLGENEYVASHPEKGKYRKNVSYFLAEAPYQELKLGPSGGLDEARWFKLEEISDLKIYNDIVPLIAKAIEIITK
ncbi:MAG: N utilization substance protein B-like protein [Candidatus Nomurabacteria bacterium GW2011_GWB1_37_5]|uniref:Transcription antitermination protein NusB n=1 Tax=Candidatus Nomurabacteria bacterium GW2011_GWB1_37_5 TaxID=1618742 RepID=A0A0G0GVG6_9BACT|nr:MAG: N utilization substance protein B-like protein [Candidatus Nomurabacteria bacterium GW2011_GWB1_37_5]